MRLTIHHDPQIPPQWQDSLNKLLAADGLTPDNLPAGHQHLAIFNDRVVGLAVSQDEQLAYLAVRDVTRRRGVGHYLLAQTRLWQRQHGSPRSWLSLVGLTEEAQESLLAFLIAEGFEQDTQGWHKPL